MREVFVSRNSFTLVKSPNVRQQAARRRAVVIGGVLGLALASAAIGAMTHRSGEIIGKPHTGPFSYISSE